MNMTETGKETNISNIFSSNWNVLKFVKRFSLILGIQDISINFEFKFRIFYSSIVK